MDIPLTESNASIVFANYFSVYIANVFNFGLLKERRVLRFLLFFFLQYKGESTSVKKATFVCWGACAELRDIPGQLCLEGAQCPPETSGPSVFMRFCHFSLQLTVFIESLLCARQGLHRHYISSALQMVLLDGYCFHLSL